MKVTKDFYSQLPDFDTYYGSIKELFENGKTTGANQSEAMLNYTKLSLARTKRGLKTFKLKPELIEVAKKHHSKNWFLISEAWCGDAAQNIAQLAKIAEQSTQIELHILYRDENLELMDKFLTNGGRSIPKLIRYQSSSESYLNSWGPRPKAAQELVMQHKADGTSYAEDLHKWYALNKNQDLEQELIELISN